METDPKKDEEIINIKHNTITVYNKNSLLSHNLLSQFTIPNNCARSS